MPPKAPAQKVSKKPSVPTKPARFNGAVKGRGILASAAKKAG